MRKQVVIYDWTCDVCGKTHRGETQPDWLLNNIIGDPPTMFYVAVGHICVDCKHGNNQTHN